MGLLLQACKFAYKHVHPLLAQQTWELKALHAWICAHMLECDYQCPSKLLITSSRFKFTLEAPGMLQALCPITDMLAVIGAIRACLEP